MDGSDNVMAKANRRVSSVKKAKEQETISGKLRKKQNRHRV